MPKRKRPHRATTSSAEVPTRPFTEDHVHINNEMDVKIETNGDIEFDPMQSESTKMVLLNAIKVIAAIDEPEFDAMKPEYDVRIENSFRPEMLENSHEVAYILRGNRLHTNKENMLEITKIKRKKKKVLTKRNKKQNLPQTIDPVEIEENGRKMVKCPICNKKATRRHRSEIKNHIRHAHTREKPFKCDYCTSRFALLPGTGLFFDIVFFIAIELIEMFMIFIHLPGLRSHMESKHRKKKIHCKKCRMIFYEVEKLECHKFKCVANRSFECHLCSFKLDRVYMHLVKDHMRKVHTGETVFDCKICTEKFVDNTTLMTHTRRLHPEAMPFDCSMCTKKFHEKERLQRHEKHCRTKSRFECHICQYTNPNKSFENLQAHMRKHTGKHTFDLFKDIVFIIYSFQS